MTSGVDTRKPLQEHADVGNDLAPSLEAAQRVSEATVRPHLEQPLIAPSTQHAASEAVDVREAEVAVVVLEQYLGGGIGRSAHRPHGSGARQVRPTDS